MPYIVLLEIIILRNKRLDQVFDTQRFIVLPSGNLSIDPITACLTIKYQTGFVDDAIPAVEVTILKVL